MTPPNEDTRLRTPTKMMRSLNPNRPNESSECAAFGLYKADERYGLKMLARPRTIPHTHMSVPEM